MQQKGHDEYQDKRAEKTSDLLETFKRCIRTMLYTCKKIARQAGAELGQAQFKLGLAKVAIAMQEVASYGS